MKKTFDFVGDVFSWALALILLPLVFIGMIIGFDGLDDAIQIYDGDTK